MKLTELSYIKAKTWGTMPKESVKCANASLVLLLSFRYKLYTRILHSSDDVASNDRAKGYNYRSRSYNSLKSYNYTQNKLTD